MCIQNKYFVTIYTTVQKFYFLKEINTFIQQVCVTFIKSDSLDLWLIVLERDTVDWKTTIFT